MRIWCRRWLWFAVLASIGCNRQDTAPIGPGARVPVGGPNPLELGTERPDNPTCLAPDRPRAAIELERVFADLELSAPVGLVQARRQASEADGRWFLIEQGGFVRSFHVNEDYEAEGVVTTDLTGRVAPGPNLDERGLLGIALHPRFPEDPRVFLMFNTNEGGLSDQVSSFTASEGRIDAASEVSLITIADPYTNHNGGALVFGPDGLLYIGAGDGGDGGDPHEHGQNPDSLLGKILRIDVDQIPSGRAYGIPTDNPFAEGGGAPEIYATGLRNPWRMSFDRDLGTLWVGDVGQNLWEEVSIVERGGNYGWNVWEGDDCFESSSCPREGFEPPVHVYAHSGDPSNRSVTGGYVYRGTEIPDLVGSYVYGDYSTGELWRLSPREGGGYENHDLLRAGFNISSFAESDAGELFVIDYAGSVYRLSRGEGGAAAQTLVPLLSQTGCVDPKQPSRVTSAAIPYEVALPFWSDGADKERFLALPNGTALTPGSDGDLELPPGAVTLKHFRHEGRLIETRLYVRHADGEHSGYSYAWREDGSDAELVTETTTRRFGDFEWTYPGRDQCNQCHTAVAGRSLGLELAQLDIENSRVAVNQLDALRRLGMLEGTGRANVAFADDASLEQRARAYLHVNCGNCHQPGGPGRGGLDLRFEASLEESGLCGQATLGALSTADGRLLTPGSAEDSVFYVRASTRGDDAMPPLASRVVDDTGMALLAEYVESLASCP